jgi:hypothetical protein
MEQRPLIEFKDLVGIVYTDNPDGSCLFEIPELDMVIHTRPCNAMTVTDNLEVDHLYYFGMYNGKTILLEHLGKPEYVGIHCRYLYKVLGDSFPDDKFNLLPIHVRDIADKKVMFTFCNGQHTNNPMYVVYQDDSGAIDIRKVSKC